MILRRALIGAAALAAIAAVCWWSIDKASFAPAAPEVSHVPSIPHVVPPPDSSVSLAALSDPAFPPEKKIRRVHELVRTYTMAMRSRSGVPIADNADFVRALTGSNILGVVFLPPDHPSISRQGELLDPWQSPYFFHALAGDSWEVVSAGPDRICFNADDLIFPPNPNRNPQSLANEGLVGVEGK
jgi:hypothetical protein